MDNSPPSPWITWSWSREGNCHLSRYSIRMCLTTSPVVRQLWSMPLNWCQVPIASSDVGLTGFVTSQGHYHWRFMPFGLRNAPATFSRLVTKVFKGLEEFCEAY